MSKALFDRLLAALMSGDETERYNAAALLTDSVPKHWLSMTKGGPDE